MGVGLGQVSIISSNVTFSRCDVAEKLLIWHSSNRSFLEWVNKMNYCISIVGTRLDYYTTIKFASLTFNLTH